MDKIPNSNNDELKTEIVNGFKNAIVEYPEVDLNLCPQKLGNLLFNN